MSVNDVSAISSAAIDGAQTAAQARDWFSSAQCATGAQIWRVERPAIRAAAADIRYTGRSLCSRNGQDGRQPRPGLIQRKCEAWSRKWKRHC
jgi:hypothetical protein